MTYPLDVVRRRMQIIGMKSVTTAFQPVDYAKGTMRAVRLVWQKEGARGMFRGISLNYVKVAPMVAISFTVFEESKKITREVFGIELKE